MPKPDAVDHALPAILWGGLLAGTGDLLFAFGYYGLRLGIFQNVAGGLIGRQAALTGGWATFALGVLLHYVIAGIWAGLFWLVARSWIMLLRRAVPAGLGYGLIVFYGMNVLVLPLSALHTRAWPPPFAPWPIAAHVLLVGLPIALVARHFSRRAPEVKPALPR